MALAAQHKVAVLALDEVVPFDLGVATQMFYAARDAANERLYSVKVCTPTAEPVRTSAGYSVTPDHGPDLIAEADTVIIPGIHEGLPLTDGVNDPAVSKALALRQPGARVMSICTGAF